MKHYNINMEKLCEQCGLGRLTAEPKQISGGLLHRMFDVHTETGRFAVKALNPNIMEREEAYGNYVASERIANALRDVVHVSCANSYNEEYLQKIDGQYYLVFDFIEGNALKAGEITPEHAYKIGQVLGKIHGADLAELNIECNSGEESMTVDWEGYAEKGSRKALPWADRMLAHTEKLIELTEKMNGAAVRLAGNERISHGDLDPKNVMWISSEPVIIDWEAASFYNGYSDFLETALYWSQKEDLSVDGESFLAFAKGYFENYTLNRIDWRDVLYKGLSSKLGWLEYSLKRSLGVECADEEEQKLGGEQVIYTIDEINAYVENFNEIIFYIEKAIGSDIS